MMAATTTARMGYPLFIPRACVGRRQCLAMEASCRTFASSSRSSSRRLTRRLWPGRQRRTTAPLRPHARAPELLHHRPLHAHQMLVAARMRVEALAGGERPVIFVDHVRLGVGQQLAGFQELVEVGDETNLVAGNSPHDVARLDLARVLE